jgi:hypothetical protein
MRYLTGVLILIATGVACSRAPERIVADLPTAPSAIAAVTDRTNTFGDGRFGPGVAGKLDVLFPPRNEALQFRNELETAYQVGLGRSPSMSAVDKEGEVVWIQEYIRYRVNGCDHGTAVQRVAEQIAGRPAGGICAAPPAGLVLFPSRADVFAFRQQLETLYLTVVAGVSGPLARVPQPTFVDMEGASIWIAEYLRYRTNECDHPTGSQKTLVQLSGAPPPATCFVPCSFIINPSSLDVSKLASNHELEVRPNRAGCEWAVASDVTWITIPAFFANGNTFTMVPYSIAVNDGPDRVGHITLTHSGGTLRLTVNQSGSPFGASISMFDNARSPAATTECWIRSSPTTCSFTATASMPGTITEYNWAASYNYAGTTRNFAQNTASPNFSFSDTCGLAGSSADNPEVRLELTLIIRDNLGNQVILQAGINHPLLMLRVFPC